MDQSMQQMAAQGQPPQGAPQQQAPEQAPGKSEGDESQDIPEIERGLQAITQVLYKNAETADAFTNMINPRDPVGSLVQAAMQLITQFDNQLNLPERVMAALAVIGAGELIEIAEAAHGITLDEKQQQQVVMATWEGLLGAYGVDGEDAVNFAGSTSEQEQSEAVSTYQGAM